jgi:hypothetical protein
VFELYTGREEGQPKYFVSPTFNRALKNLLPGIYGVQPMASDNEKTDSRYKALVVPEFKSTIPPHVLARLPESERYLVEMVSKVEQRDAFLINAATGGQEAAIALDIRVTKVEKFIERLTHKWSVIAYIGLLSMPVIVKILVERWLSK